MLVHRTSVATEARPGPYAGQMSENDRPAPPAPRLHRILSNPVGWLAFLFMEAGVLFALFAALPLERFSTNVATTMELVLIVAAVVVNYRIRRLYLTDWWRGSSPGD